MLRAARFALPALVLAACATAAPPPGPTARDQAAGTTPTTITAPETTTTVSAPKSVPTTDAPIPTTTTTAGPAADPDKSPGFPDARPPGEIPWEQVGPGWVLVRYQETTPEWSFGAPEGLFLIDPEHTVYGVDDWEAGLEILDWSPDGTRILTFENGLVVTDLRSGDRQTIPTDLPDDPLTHRIDARFTRPDDGGLVVRLLEWDRGVTLLGVGLDGERAATFAEADLTGITFDDPEYVAFGATWLSATDGNEVVVSTAAGIGLVDGDTIRPLDTPGLGCTLSRWWDEERALASCSEESWIGSSCWNQGPAPGGRSLWAIPRDGSAATRLTPEPVCTPDALPPDYRDALAHGEVIAAQAASCCECGGSLDLRPGPEARSWDGGGEAPACSPDLIAVTDTGFLIHDTLTAWETGSELAAFLGVIFEIDPTGATIATVTPDPFGHHGGVVQVLTTVEAAG